MSRHAVRATVAVAALSLASSPIQAQDKPSEQELVDLRASAKSGDADAQFRLGLSYANGVGVPEDLAEAVAGTTKRPSRATPKRS